MTMKNKTHTQYDIDAEQQRRERARYMTEQGKVLDRLRHTLAADAYLDLEMYLQASVMAADDWADPSGKVLAPTCELPDNMAIAEFIMNRGLYNE